LAGGAAAADQPETVRLSIGLPNRPTAGARVFAQKACTRCHTLGRQTSAAPRIGPDLGRQLFSGTVMDLAGALWNHAPVMQAKMQELKIQPPTMTSTDVADVVAALSAYRFYVTDVGRPGDAAAGRRVFTAKKCSGCHVVDGSVWDRPGPSLQKYRGRSSSIFLAQAMWNHSTTMESAMRARSIPWPKFAAREMDDLIAYLQAGNTGAPEGGEYFDPGSPLRGKELFSEKQCLSCHAVGGKGGRGGPDLGVRHGDLVASVPTIAGVMWNHSLAMTAEFERQGIPRVSFSGQEMVDVIAYLYFVNYATVYGTPARGQKLFADRCSACHMMEGGNTGPGLNLTVVPQLDEPFAIIAAMWNHVPTMSLELQKRGLTWPRFEAGEAADLAAFLVSRRPSAGASSQTRR
jgi:cytochrome c2